MNERNKDAAKARGETRSADIVRRVEKAMTTIKAEMKGNSGVYPHNGGAISMAEVARRAGIHCTTLHTTTQQKLGEQVKLWVDTLKKKEVIGRVRVRRTFAERAEDWKARYLALQNSHIKTELDLQQAEAERDEARAETEKLCQKNAALLDQLMAGDTSKVTSITTRRK